MRLRTGEFTEDGKDFSVSVYCEPFAGFSLYFPRRLQRPAALRALIDWVRRELRE